LKKLSKRKSASEFILDALFYVSKTNLYLRIEGLKKLLVYSWYNRPKPNK